MREAGSPTAGKGGGARFQILRSYSIHTGHAGVSSSRLERERGYLQRFSGPRSPYIRPGTPTGNLA